MEEIINDIRNWNREWDNFYNSKTSRGKKRIHYKQPLHLDEFTEEMNKKYKVEKI